MDKRQFFRDTLLDLLSEYDLLISERLCEDWLPHEDFSERVANDSKPPPHHVMAALSQDPASVSADSGLQWNSFSIAPPAVELGDSQKMRHGMKESSELGDSLAESTVEGCDKTVKAAEDGPAYESNSKESSTDIPFTGRNSTDVSREGSQRKKMGSIISGHGSYNSESAAIIRNVSMIVLHPFFERLVGCIILANVIIMAYAADYAIHNVQDPDIPGNVGIEMVFCILYSVELGLRLFVFRWDFFKPPDRGWNLFDMALVFQSIYEQFASLSGLSAGSGNMSFLRSMRLLKMVKMLRVIRLMRSMFELRIILQSIMGSMKSMFWSMVLVIVILFMFSLVFVQASANHLGSDDVLPQDEIDAILKHWGSISEAMITLFECSTNGKDWSAAAESLMEVSIAFFIIFCLYIAFFNFVILNTITSLFVEATISSSMKDYQASIQAELERKDEYMDKLRLLFEEMDDSGDGVVSLEEFTSRIDHPKMIAFASALGLEINDAKHFFNLLSDGGNKDVDLETFVTGCIRMKGQALSMDLQDLMIKQQRFQAAQANFESKIEDTLQTIRDKLDRVDEKESKIDRRIEQMSSQEVKNYGHSLDRPSVLSALSQR